MQLCYGLAALSALFALATCQSAPYYLTPVTTNIAGLPSVQMNLRSDAFTVTPATNGNVQPSAAATAALNKINHFVILVRAHHAAERLTTTHSRGRASAVD